MTTVSDDRYASIARDLADALRRYARDRRLDDQKEIGALQLALCQLRREEMRPDPELESEQ